MERSGEAAVDAVAATASGVAAPAVGAAEFSARCLLLMAEILHRLGCIKPCK